MIIHGTVGILRYLCELHAMLMHSEPARHRHRQHIAADREMLLRRLDVEQL